MEIFFELVKTDLVIKWNNNKTSFSGYHKTMGSLNVKSTLWAKHISKNFDVISKQDLPKVTVSEQKIGL